MQQAPVQTIAHQLDADLASVEDRISHLLSPDDGTIAALLASADQLAKANALEASHFKGRILALTGDRRPVDYWFANARRLRDDWRADFNQASCLLSLGYFSDAATLTTRLLTIDHSSLAMTAGLAMAVFDLAGAQEACEVLHCAGIKPNGVDPSFAKDALKVLSDFDVPTEHVRAALDVVGEILRENRLWWLGRYPKLFAHHSAEDFGILYELPIGVSIEESIRLTNECLERLLDRSLLLAGFGFSFIGLGPRGKEKEHQLRLRRVQ